MGLSERASVSPFPFYLYLGTLRNLRPIFEFSGASLARFVTTLLSSIAFFFPASILTLTPRIMLLDPLHLKNEVIIRQVINEVVVKTSIIGVSVLMGWP